METRSTGHYHIPGDYNQPRKNHPVDTTAEAQTATAFNAKAEKPSPMGPPGWMHQTWAPPSETFEPPSDGFTVPDFLKS